MDNTVNKTTDNSDSKGLDFFRIISVLQKGWILIVIFAIAFGGIGYVSGKMAYVPQYMAQCSIYVGVIDAADSANNGSLDGDSNKLNYFATAVVDLSYSRKTQTAVCEKLDAMGYNTGGRFPARMEIVRGNTTIIVYRFTASSRAVAVDTCTAFSEVIPEIGKEYVGDTHKIMLLDKPEFSALLSNSLTRPYTFAGMAVGALLISLFLIIKDFMRNTVRSGSDLQNKLDLNIIGNVPMVVRPGMKKGQLPKGLLVNDSSSGFTFIETYKSIRTKIETISEKNNYKKIIISSTVENEGKTTVAANIAISLAQNGRSVLLIDGDLRKPAVHKLLSVKRSSKVGMLPILRGEATWQESIKYVEQMGIFILHSGSSSENSAEYLSTYRMEELMSSIEDEFDYIIIDSPPTSMVTDSSVISGYCDAAIIVVKQDVARLPDINRAVQDLGERGTPVIGCVYNVVENASSGYGYSKKYYKKYYRGYGKKYGYGGYGYGKGYGGYGYGKGYGGYGYGGYGYGGYGYGSDEPHEEDSDEKDSSSEK